MKKEGLHPAALLDRLVSRSLRYDVSRTDVVKWVGFARNLLAVLLLSVVSTAGLIALLSTWQASDLLHGALRSEAHALAEAIARGSYVPLSLEDRETLERITESFKTNPDISSLRILDAAGSPFSEWSRPAPAGQLLVEYPIRPREAVGAVTVGKVEIGMSLERIRAKSRSIALINVLASGILTAVISLIGFLLVGKLTERMRELVGEAKLAEELQVANRELEAFSYSISHDLRAPLRHVLGFIELLEKRTAKSLDDESRRYMTLVADAAKRMGAMIDDLLNFSKMGRAELLRTEVPLRGLVQRVIDDLAMDVRERNVTWEIGDLPTVRCDPSMMQLVMQNLIGNAVKFTRGKDPAVIRVAAERKGGEWVVSVKDNGAGFDPKHADKLFNVFRRLHGRDEFEGTGIGLANVRRIVERHGGRAWADAEPGKGASFYFTLPAK